MFRFAAKNSKQLFQLEARRFLNMHEYQSKDLLRKFGLNVQKGAVASTPEEAFSVARGLKEEGAEDLILKCQILAGGRGKGSLSSGLKGGVKICDSPEKVRDFSEQMIGYYLVTHQTSERGEKVNQVLVHEGVNISKELYLAVVLDRQSGGPVFIASTEGGMDIEEVAEKNPNAISMFPIDPINGLDASDAERIADALGLVDGAMRRQAADQFVKLYNLFCECDATQVEINPLAVTDKNMVVCVDAKINFDDNAAFRHKDLFDMEDKATVDPREAAAQAAGLNYVGLDGSIGCLVNGAGLAMATMDIIKLYGGEPANFLDVGGGANAEQVAEAFRIIQSDHRVKAVFVNIFGGIMKCDIIAEGIIKAAKEVDLKLPLVVRLQGTNVERGTQLLSESGIKCEVINDMDEAAMAVVKYN